MIPAFVRDGALVETDHFKPFDKRNPQAPFVGRVYWTGVAHVMMDGKNRRGEAIKATVRIENLRPSRDVIQVAS